MKPNLLNTQDEFIFAVMCEAVQDWHSSVATSKELVRNVAAKGHPVSLYSMRKTLRKLEAAGLVERRSEGNPSWYGCEGECLDEGGPPRNGWGVTEQGRQTEAYKRGKDEYIKSLAEWANGKYDEKEETT